MKNEKIKQVLQRMEEEKERKNQFPKPQSVILNNWIRERKGSKIDGCMCSERVREEIYNTALSLYNEKEEE